jgi:hypothetical protein
MANGTNVCISAMIVAPGRSQITGPPTPKSPLPLIRHHSLAANWERANIPIKPAFEWRHCEMLTAAHNAKTPEVERPRSETRQKGLYKG